MAELLRSLRVIADLEARGYTRGAAEKVAADEAMINSAGAFGASQARLDASLAKAAPGVARLSRQWVEGYSEAEKFGRAVEQIATKLGQGLGDDRAAVILEAISNKFGKLASSADAARDGYTAMVPIIDQVNAKLEAQVAIASRAAAETDRAATAKSFQDKINAQFRIGEASPSARSSAFDIYDQMANSAARLKQELDPLAAAQDRLNAELMEYTVMADLGLLKSTELAVAQNSATQRFNVLAENIKRFGTSARLGRHELANMSYQFNDIAVMMASGQNPFVTFMQQGMQIGQMFSGMRLGEAAKEVGRGIISFITNPVNLAVLAFATLAAGAAYAYRSMKGGGQSVEDMLKRTADLTTKLGDAYEGTGQKIAKLRAPDVNVIEFQVKVNQENAKRDIQKQLAEIANSISTTPTGYIDVARGRLTPGLLASSIGAFADIENAITGITNRRFGPLQDDINALFAAAKTGTADIDAFRTKLVDLGKSSPELAKVTGEALGLTDEIERLNREMIRLGETAKATTSEIDEMFNKPRKFLGDPAGNRQLYDFLPDVRSQQQQLDDAYNQVKSQYGVGADILAEADRVYADAKAGLSREQEKSLRLAQLEIQSIYAKTPLEKANIAAERERANAINTSASAGEIALNVERARNQVLLEGQYALDQASAAARRNFEVEMQAIGAKSPAEKARIAGQREFNSLLDSGNSLAEINARVTMATAIAYQQATNAISEQNRQRREAANDNIQAAELEIRMVGLSAQRQAELRANFASYLDLKRQAASNGLEFDQKEYELLAKRNAEAARLLEQAKRQRFQDELDNAAANDNLSPREQGIRQQLKSQGFEEGGPDWEYFHDKILDAKEAQDSFFYGAKSGYRQLSEDVHNFAQDGSKIVNDFYQKSEDIFVKFAKTGKLSFGDLVDTMIEDFARMEFRILASNVMDILSGGKNNKNGGIIDTIGGIVSGIFGGFFAEGGTLAPGKYGIVGEKGPELIKAGPSPVTVYPGIPGAQSAPANVRVSTPITVNISSPQGTTGTAKQSTDGAGNVSVDVLIVETVNKAVAQGKFNGAFGNTYGLRPLPVRRG